MAELIEAVFENGVLRPTKPLVLAEGETVFVSFSSIPAHSTNGSSVASKYPLPPEQANGVSLLEQFFIATREAKSLDEYFDVVDRFPDEDKVDYGGIEEYDRLWAKYGPIHSFRNPEPVR